MTKNANYEINHITATITLTKPFAKAAGILNTPEYKTLMEIRRQNPSYAVELRKIKKADKKCTYLNLTYNHMGEFISEIEKDEAKKKERLVQLETIKKLSKAQPAPYAYVKCWFLENYGTEYNRYNKAA